MSTIQAIHDPIAEKLTKLSKFVLVELVLDYAIEWVGEDTAFDNPTELEKSIDNRLSILKEYR